MSLQRGADIRGWEGVTRDMSVNNEERAAWRFSMFSMILTVIVTGSAAYILSQTDIPTIAKALLSILVLLFTVVLVSGIYSTMVRRASGRGNGLEDEIIGVDTNEDLYTADPDDVVSKVADRMQILSARSTAATAPATAQEGSANAAARAAETERQREAAEAARKAEADAAAVRAAREAQQKADAAAKAAADAERAKAQAAAEQNRDGDAIKTEEGVRPDGMEGPRGGVSDDLKKIKGVGPKLELVCNSLGFWHFDQIAAWTADEIAWVDSNLEGFYGRVSRDEWVAQAKILAAGGETEFSQRQKDK